MQHRFVSIWFHHLRTDWFSRRNPGLREVPFILASPERGKMMVTAINYHAMQEGIRNGIAVADARAIYPALKVMDDQQDLSQKLLTGIGSWCIRFTPSVSVDGDDGLLMDVSGCPHLWGGEKEYLTDILKRLQQYGYHANLAIADTIGAAWAMARFGRKQISIVPSALLRQALNPLPPQALRIDHASVDHLKKLGLYTIGSFSALPRPSLRRRFGAAILQRIDQAMGDEEEWIDSIEPPEIYQERLPCFDPIVTATGIEIAIQRLLGTLCKQLQTDEKGLRKAVLKCYRLDGKIESIDIGTNRPTSNVVHLFKLFELKICTIKPDLGIELFLLSAPVVEDLSVVQEQLWKNAGGIEDPSLAQLLDRIGSKFGSTSIHRFVPSEHYWPERSYQLSEVLQQKETAQWNCPRPRPVKLLSRPEPVEVTAPIPDYPPMMFRYKGKLHKIAKADGPERIEQEWWIEEGLHRDYYYVEDEEGQRYWIFRAGHYDAERSYRWFLHGYFS